MDLSYMKRVREAAVFLRPSERLREDWAEWDAEHPGTGRSSSGESPVLQGVRGAIANEGGTIDQRTGVQPSTGYAVGGWAHPEIMDVGKLNEDTFADWALANRDELSKPNTYVGVWFNKEDGKVWLEPSRVYSSRTEAVSTGAARNQVAIYDLKDGGEGEINTGGDGDMSRILP